MRTIISAILDHLAQFLDLVGEPANLLLHFFNATESGRRIEGATHARLGSAAVGSILVALALDVLLHLMGHLLQVLRWLIEPCCSEVPNGLHDMPQASLNIAGTTGIRTL